ncbi:hypothetical protein [Zooshikella ganghwensis]|uniref:hypothetical protein n=1 Tax=Zooshikella ganghwensis TaxID=202772 RepID=UPI0004289BBF|nr:hypothetical protein [Zooshikella ganghwensis]
MKLSTLIFSSSALLFSMASANVVLAEDNNQYFGLHKAEYNFLKNAAGWSDKQIESFAAKKRGKKVSVNQNKNTVTEKRTPTSITRTSSCSGSGSCSTSTSVSTTELTTSTNTAQTSSTTTDCSAFAEAGSKLNGWFLTEYDYFGDYTRSALAPTTATECAGKQYYQVSDSSYDGNKVTFRSASVEGPYKSQAAQFTFWLRAADAYSYQSIDFECALSKRNAKKLGKTLRTYPKQGVELKADQITQVTLDGPCDRASVFSSTNGDFQIINVEANYTVGPSSTTNTAQVKPTVANTKKTQTTEEKKSTSATTSSQPTSSKVKSLTNSANKQPVTAVATSTQHTATHEDQCDLYSNRHLFLEGWVNADRVLYGYEPQECPGKRVYELSGSYEGGHGDPGHKLRFSTRNAKKNAQLTFTLRAQQPNTEVTVSCMTRFPQKRYTKQLVELNANELTTFTLDNQCHKASLYTNNFETIEIMDIQATY